MKAATEAMSSNKMGSYKMFRVFIIFFSPENSHKLKRLDKALKGPRKHSVAKKLKNDFVQTQADSSPFN
jgi:hypothetical protein